MTDEERQKLCKILRDHGDRHFDDMAADEIERLAAELCNLNAEPRPDASAGLIEAAELLSRKGKDDLIHDRIEAAVAFGTAAAFLRSRAADRSGK